jgi:hypothetical protein
MESNNKTHRTYFGVAIRLCIYYGFHRETTTTDDKTRGVEIRQRVFWTPYVLDCQISIEMGWPFAISDGDIDAQLPSDVNNNTNSQATIALSLRFAMRGSMISYFIHTI